MKGARAARGARGLANKLGTGVVQSAKNRAARGAANPFGQRAVRSGAAGRQRVPVYSGRSGTGPMVNAPGKTVFASPTQGRTGRRVAGGFAQKNQATKGIPGAPERGSTVYRGEIHRDILISMEADLCRDLDRLRCLKVLQTKHLEEQ